MAILTPEQLQASNASTYTTNGVGAITGATAKSFNVDFISSSITVSQTSSMSVASALTASYVNPLNQDVIITGSAILKPNVGVSEFPFIINQVSDGTSTGGNLISTRNTTTSSGSVVVSGSCNLVLLSSGGGTTADDDGYAYGFIGDNSIVTTVPFITGSNGLPRNRPLPTLTRSVINGNFTTTDNRPSTTTTPILITNVNSNSSFSYTTSTGSVNFFRVIAAGLSFVLNVTGSNGATKNVNGIGVIGNTNSILIDSPTATGNITGLVIGGNNNTVLVSGSNTTMQAVNLMGYQLRATGSASATTNFGSLFAGRWNAIDNTALVKETAFAVGTGTASGSRRTSFHVSASGLTTVSNGLNLSGSLLVTGSLTITGSAYGNVVPVSVASNTASIDLQAGNFFTVTLDNNATTFFNFANVRPGLTANLVLTTGTVSTASFSSNVKQPSGSFYLPTSGSGNIDALSVAAVDSSNLYLVASKFFV